MYPIIYHNYHYRHHLSSKYWDALLLYLWHHSSYVAFLSCIVLVFTMAVLELGCLSNTLLLHMIKLYHNK